MVFHLLYKIKHRFRPLFRLAESIVGRGVSLKHRKRIEEARRSSKIEGEVDDACALIRMLCPEDLSSLVSFFDAIPESHLAFFHPHGFSRGELKVVIRSPHILQYGFFVEGNIIGYAILKLYPGKKAFLGTLVGPTWTGKGIGKFLSLYLRWQCRVIGFELRSTISKSNLASLKSHQKVGPVKKLTTLPNDYDLYEHPLYEEDETPPVLKLPMKNLGTQPSQSEV